MKHLCIWIGAIVLLLMVASSGVMRGDMCIGSIGCVGATHGGITLHGKATP